MWKYGQELSKTQSQQQNHADFDVRDSQEFINYGNNVSNFDKNCLNEQNTLEMQSQNNRGYQNDYQMYQNYPVQGDGMGQEQNTMQYSNNMDQQQNTMQYSNNFDQKLLMIFLVPNSNCSNLRRVLDFS